MSHNIPDEPFKTFEIKVPNTPEALEALEAFRRTLGALGLSSTDNEHSDPTAPAAIDEERASPNPEILTERALAELSDELWGSEDYGLSVVDYFNCIKERLYRRLPISILRNGYIPKLPYSLQDKIVDGISLSIYSGSSIEEYNFSYEALQRRAQFVWDTQYDRRLFAMEKSDDLDPFDELDAFDDVLLFVPGEITKKGLAAYAVDHGYDKHELHGTMGKMLDVINVAAGIPEEEIYERDTDDEFVDRDTLLGKMTRELRGVPGAPKGQFYTKLKNAVEDQLRSGQPYRHGEIILEGQLTLGPGNFTYGSIAKSSLIAIMDSCKQGHPMRPFLRQFDS